MVHGSRGVATQVEKSFGYTQLDELHMVWDTRHITSKWKVNHREHTVRRS